MTREPVADEQADDEPFFWDDPREKPREGATIVRLREGQLDLQTFPPLLMHYLGLYRGDAIRTCAQGKGIIVDNVDVGVAEGLAEAFRAHGEDCFVIPAAFLVPLPPARPVHSARPTETDLQPVDSAGRVHSAPWDKAIVLAAAHVAVETVSTRWVPGRRGVCAAMLGGMAGAVIAHGIGGERKTTSHSTLHTLVNLVYLGKLRRYRIDSREFDYRLLGKHVQPSSEGNIRTLLQWLLPRVPRARTNLDRHGLLTGAPRAIPTMTEHALEDTVQWLINLERFERK